MTKSVGPKRNSGRRGANIHGGPLYSTKRDGSQAAPSKTTERSPTHRLVSFMQAMIPTKVSDAKKLGKTKDEKDAENKNKGRVENPDEKGVEDKSDSDKKSQVPKTEKTMDI